MRGVRRLDGAAVDHGDDGHGEVDAHRVHVGEAEETQERKEVPLPEERPFVCEIHSLMFLVVIRVSYEYRVNCQVAYNLLLTSIYDIEHWPRLDWK